MLLRGGTLAGKLFHQGVRRLAHDPGHDDAPGAAPEVLDQHDAERNRDRPQLAYGQRILALIGEHEPAQRRGIEMAVRVGDVSPCHSENPGIADERTVGQLRQLPVVPGGKVGANLADLLFDDVEVVEQPFRGRSNGSSRVDGARYVAVRVKQHPLVLRKARSERRPPPPMSRNRLGGGKSRGVLFQALDAEELGADGILVVPRDDPPQARRTGHELVCKRESSIHVGGN